MLFISFDENIRWAWPATFAFATLIFYGAFVRSVVMSQVFWKVVDLIWVTVSALTLLMTLICGRADSLFAMYASDYREAFGAQIRIQNIVHSIDARYCLGRFSDEAASAPFEEIKRACDETTATIKQPVFLSYANFRVWDQPFRKFAMPEIYLVHGLTLAEFQLGEQLLALNYEKAQFNIFIESLAGIRDEFYPWFYRALMLRTVWFYLFAILVALRVSRSLADIKEARRL